MKDSAYRKAYNSLDLKYQLVGALIDARARKGFSQEKLARKAGTTQSAIARFESGAYNPSIDFMQKLSNALDLTLTVTPRYVKP